MILSIYLAGMPLLRTSTRNLDWILMIQLYTIAQLDANLGKGIFFALFDLWRCCARQLVKKPGQKTWPAIAHISQVVLQLDLLPVTAAQLPVGWSLISLK